MSKAEELVRQVEALARQNSAWADLSNALFDPGEGVLAKAFPTREERYAFIHTEEFKQVQQILARAMEGDQLLGGAAPTKITEFMVQLSTPEQARAVVH